MDGSNKDVGFDNINGGDGENNFDLGDVFSGSGDSKDDGDDDIDGVDTNGGDDTNCGHGGVKFDFGDDIDDGGGDDEDDDDADDDGNVDSNIGNDSDRSDGNIVIVI